MDAALLESDGVGLDLRLRCLHALHVPYPRDLRELILRVVAASSATARQVGPPA